MTLLAEAVNVVLAVVLLWAGLEKARAVASFVSALRKLRAPPVAAPVLAWIVIAIELSAGLGLVYGPSVIALAAVTALAIAFAGAGLIALRRGQRIPCHCFGTYGPRVLGRDQLIAFPLWIAGVAIVWSQREAHWNSSGASLLVAITLGMAALRVATALRAAHAARGDRRSARIMYRWLTP